MSRALVAIGVFSLALARLAVAGDGVYEINQICANGPGCFPGDSAGFPVTLVLQASYRLTSNVLNGNPNVRTIQVSTDNVTIDLNGFSVLGPVTCTGDGAAISCLNIGSGAGIYGVGASHVTVANGTVRGAGHGGIVLGASSRVDGVTAENNGSVGISAESFSVVGNSIARRNSNRGFVLRDGAIVHHSIAAQNGAEGIWVETSSTVTECSAYQNGDDGILAIVSVVSRNASYLNTGDQIQAIGSSVVGNLVSTFTGGGWGLNFSGGSSSGYGQNTIANSGGAGLVTGTGVSAGDNNCNGVLC